MSAKVYLIVMLSAMMLGVIMAVVCIIVVRKDTQRKYARYELSKVDGRLTWLYRDSNSDRRVDCLTYAECPVCGYIHCVSYINEKYEEVVHIDYYCPNCKVELYDYGNNLKVIQGVRGKRIFDMSKRELRTLKIKEKRVL